MARHHMTIVCPNCHRDNPAGKGFCRFCGSRLTPPPPEQDAAVDNDETHRLLEALRESKQAMGSLQQDLESATRELDEARDELNVLRQKAITDTVNDTEERMAEQSRLRGSLAESQKSVETLRSELETAKLQSSAIQDKLEEEIAAGQAKIAALALELDTTKQEVAAELHGKVAASEKLIDRMKQQHANEIRKATDDHHEKIAALTRDLATVKERVVAEFQGRLTASEKLIETLRQRHVNEIGKAADDSQEKVAQKDSLIEGLQKKLHGLVEDGKVPATTRRSFGTMAMAVLATVSGGAGSVGGYFLQPGAASGAKQAELDEAKALNEKLQTALQSQNEVYERTLNDLKRAEARLRDQPAPNANTGANEELQRQLNEARATSQQQLSEARAKDQQQEGRLAALQAELDRSKQDIAARDQTIAARNQTIEQLNSQLQAANSSDARAPEAKPYEREVKPRPRSKTIDLEQTIRNLEREYGIPRIGR
ncbi:hypothetical protein P0R31_00520 [Bradyrhizobium yuanmingense]|uniref:hypothetical protein n=1 Tax=Bradyrhizobium yuanmingense TaxID=108015 RepID=UPI0023BA287F|nr:hypothetical protein [Bradyrhizobium yuanmingense]MDF0515727.1 hypothetical protein [Bradyrhizobium yuanmingense]